jgi:hypothetical protein
VAVAWLGSGFSDDDYWRVTNTGGTVIAPTVQVTRTNAYLTPR